MQTELSLEVSCPILEGQVKNGLQEVHGLAPSRPQCAPIGESCILERSMTPPTNLVSLEVHRQGLCLLSPRSCQLLYPNATSRQGVWYCLTQPRAQPSLLEPLTCFAGIMMCLPPRISPLFPSYMCKLCSGKLPCAKVKATGPLVKNGPRGEGTSWGFYLGVLWTSSRVWRVFISAPLLVPLPSGALELLSTPPSSESSQKSYLRVHWPQTPTSWASIRASLIAKEAHTHGPLSQSTSAQLTYNLRGATGIVLVHSGCFNKNTMN